MLIEDSDDEATLARRALERTGVPHTLVHYSDSASAVDALYATDAESAPPALILLDLQMPRMDGKNVLRELRGNPLSARVPIVVLTTSSHEQDLVDAYCLGANSYFVKPTSFAQFTDEMVVLATYWLGLNVSPPAFRTMWPDGGRPIGAAVNALKMLGKPRLETEVVLVDANARDLDRTKDALSSMSVRTRELGSFNDVKRFLRSAGGPPPLLDNHFPRLFLVDVDLDRGDGRDVLQALRYRTDHQAVVVMFSRNCEPAYVSECYRVKVSGVVQKPDDPDAYRDAVRLLAYYWMFVNEPPPDPIWTTRAMAHPG